jgi:phage-related protein
MDILYVFKDIIILTNTFEKHSDNVPKSEIKTAKKYRDDFLGRYTEQEIRGLL